MRPCCPTAVSWPSGWPTRPASPTPTSAWRATPDGSPTPGFGGGGFVTTDIAGHGDAANAVAVQPDGKIVVAGFAEVNAIDSDFALARYNADGTLDTSFSADGIVTTDLGTESDDARALAIQPDGKIVLAGDTDQGIALARYPSDGKLDPTFDADDVCPWPHRRGQRRRTDTRRGS